MKFKALLLLILFSTSLTFGRNSKIEKPNIIYILADDLGMGDLSITGQTKIQTPNIDRIGNEGIQFTNHYSGSTVCAPSRCAIMTGKHMGHATIRMNHSLKTRQRVPLNAHDITVADLLKKAGYTTGATGKWGLGEVGTTGVPWKQGFDYWYGYINQKNAHSYYPSYLYENDAKIMLPENENKQKVIYAEDLIINKSLDFIEENKLNPFFFYFAVTLPHAELEIPDEYLKKYIGKVESGEWSLPMATYAAMVSKLDADVGAILDKLKKLGIDENTLIIFTSDNGVHSEDGYKPSMLNSTAGMRGIKRDLYEGGIHVPMLVRWPAKIKQASKSNHISAFWDVLPTLCDIVGIAPPKDIDGISFAPTLLGKKQDKHDYLYWEFLGRGEVRQATRFGNWKAVRYSLDKPIELYNLKSDPQEKNDIGSSNPKLVKKALSIFQKAHVENEDFSFQKFY